MAAPNFLDTPQAQAAIADLEGSRGLEPGTLRALAMQESGGNPNAVSSAGARGLTQFMPATAKEYNVDVTDPLDSLRGTADYLFDLKKQYKGSLPAALAHYNGGGSQAQQVLAGKDPSKTETRNYVTSIMGKIANAVVPSANAAEVPPQAAPQAAPQQAPAPVSKDMAQIQKNIVEAKRKGFSDQAIAAGLENNPLTRAQVSQMGDEGVDPSDVVKQFGGDALVNYQKELEDLNPTKGMTAGEKFLAGAGKSFVDLGHGAQQLWYRATGDDEALKQSQADEAERAKLDAPLMDTGMGKVGYAAGALAPMAVTGGAGALAEGTGLAARAATAAPTLARIATSAPVRLAAQGAAQGAVIPTTGDGQLASNILTGAATGGALGTAGSVVGAAGRAAGKALGAVGNKLAGGANSAETAAKIARLEAQGIPVSAADVSPAYNFAANTLNKLPFVEQLDGRAGQSQALAKALARGVGENADTIDSTLVANAQKNIGAKFDSAVQGVQLTPNSGFLNSLDNVNTQFNQLGAPEVTNAINAAKKLVNTQQTVRTANPYYRGATVNAPVAAQDLQNLSSSIGKQLSSPSVDGATKQALGKVKDIIDSEIYKGLTPAQKLEFDVAKEQWRNLQPLEAIVKATNDQGEFTARQLAAAIKKGANGAAFERGEAPYQQLATDFLSLKGNSPNQAQSFALGATMANHPLAVGAVAPLQKLFTSTNPATRNALLNIGKVPGAIGNGIATATNNPVSDAAGRYLANALARYNASNGGK